MQISEMVEKTRKLVDLFSKVEPRTWDVEAMTVELCGEVGTLADTIMIKEGYRRLRDGGELDLEDDIVDIIFMLVRIANHYNIDIDTAYNKMLNETQEKIEKRITQSNQ